MGRGSRSKGAVDTGEGGRDSHGSKEQVDTGGGRPKLFLVVSVQVLAGVPNAHEAENIRMCKTCSFRQQLLPPMEA